MFNLETFTADGNMKGKSFISLCVGILLLANLDFVCGKSIKIHLKGHEEFLVGAPPNSSALEPPKKMLRDGLRWIFGDKFDTRNNVTAPSNQSEIESNPEAPITDGIDSDPTGSVLLDRIIRDLPSKRAERRKKRQEEWNIAEDYWEEEWSLSGDAKDSLKTGIEQVSDFDIRMAELKEVRDVLVYSGSVFGSTALFISFAVLTIKYPESFICGCCFSFCCIKVCCPRLHMYMTNPEKYVHDRMNQYIPGMIVEEDGTVVHYTPTPEELELLSQIIEQLMEP